MIKRPPSTTCSTADKAMPREPTPTGGSSGTSAAPVGAGSASARLIVGKGAPYSVPVRTQRLTDRAERSDDAPPEADLLAAPFGDSAISDTLRKPAVLTRLITSTTRP